MNVVLSGPPAEIPGSEVDTALLERRARNALAGLELAEAELSLALVGDAEIAELNERWRSKPRPTDVLSFSLVEGEFADHRGGLLGDVVISVETAARQARERDRGLDEEVARLMIHGLLHLIGHDHEQDDEAEQMEAEEHRIWSTVER